ncbi:formin-like protein 20 [Chenopodium quinoa]|uniref:formin-like protein 20 n=1 Tax=Chenopodium quinoa TaxID=63459 RepID=UPI000B793689|nr:formin-like protein 20 [Chenopodium quinoa]
MSLFRRSFSRRLPDRLLEISERIYVFESCFSTSVKSEKESKSYLGGIVKSLHNCHPGASVMVFNFREGEQMSLLSDILIDYDMTVVDYPCHYEGYPLLPLEMIHYFLRSSESWLSLEGQKNVILMHCESGGWPVLAFMLAGLLLYRKQYSGEQKTLEMVYKQAPKELSSVISPINPRASQLRYLQYITGRDSASEWPPSDAPVIIDYLLLRNLPLLNGGKGCRPVVRVYGQDPSAKTNSARLIFSSFMADEPALNYSKEECEFVKLELRCQIQGDVFLECIHLHDDQVSEEMIFKVMFHTGFVQSNVLDLNCDDMDVPWNTKLARNFKAEVLFRDMNEVPVNITLELGAGEEYNDSDNEFFEVEEIFTPLPESADRKVNDSTIVPETYLVDNINRDCTLHNGTPRWDLEAEEIDDNSSEQKVLNDNSSEQKALDDIPSEQKALDDISSEQIALDDISTEQKTFVDFSSEQKALDDISSEQKALGDISSEQKTLDDIPSEQKALDDISSEQKALDAGNHKQASEAESNITSTSSKNIVVVDLCGSEIQDVKVEIEQKPVITSPARPKQNKKNKWQEITAKTIKQNRVISQWVPRVKTPQVPEANKSKAPVYKWIPKGPATPAEAAGGE